MTTRTLADNGDAVNAAFDEVYTEPRRLAADTGAASRPGDTLHAPTALVNEVYLRLRHAVGTIHDRHHFFALASQATRRVLVDHARRKHAYPSGADRPAGCRADVAGLERLGQVRVAQPRGSARRCLTGGHFAHRNSPF